ncbi:hypothetical protein [Fundidesulfovibrio agrisoli]|uniref:hypothetical protein n=1 Tax=Fundidesulfovibrio agrisoli TaxID=2922717 RepID=UPI001FAC5839|nr:hypothetical protein [Fundidesulfovibrio agrisoli]
MLRTMKHFCALALLGGLLLGAAAAGQAQSQVQAPSPYADPGYCKRTYRTCMATSQDKAQCAKAYQSCVVSATKQTNAQAAKAAAAVSPAN